MDEDFSGAGSAPRAEDDAAGGAAECTGPHLPTRAALDQLHRGVVAAAGAAGLTWLQIRYSGSGDDGGPSDYDSQPPADLHELWVEAPRWIPRWDPTAGCVYVPVNESLTVPQALEDMLDMALSLTGHAGFENDDGGYGNLTLDLEADNLILEHNDYVEHIEQSVHVLAPADTQAAAPPAVAAMEASPSMPAADQPDGQPKPGERQDD